ncbi:hypothetical protein VTK73DRAFT_9424 [Phialemonium thermophilum]|uniref:Uncharacterized protein n=1 Tax=Phialemonium thermophilum TaxID=223376 RepID=A0ABR3W2G4_9PEZI
MCDQIELSLVGLHTYPSSCTARSVHRQGPRRSPGCFLRFSKGTPPRCARTQRHARPVQRFDKTTRFGGRMAFLQCTYGMEVTRQGGIGYTAEGIHVPWVRPGNRNGTSTHDFIRNLPSEIDTVAPTTGRPIERQGHFPSRHPDDTTLDARAGLLLDFSSACPWGSRLVSSSYAAFLAGRLGGREPVEKPNAPYGRTIVLAGPRRPGGRSVEGGSPADTTMAGVGGGETGLEGAAQPETGRSHGYLVWEGRAAMHDTLWAQARDRNTLGPSFPPFLVTSLSPCFASPMSRGGGSSPPAAERREFRTQEAVS